MHVPKTLESVGRDRHVYAWSKICFSIKIATERRLVVIETFIRAGHVPQEVA